MKKRVIRAMICMGMLLSVAVAARAQDAAEMARKLQDPLGNIKAIMTDNGIEFKSGTDEESSYSFQIQPVYAMSFNRFNFISRAVIPVLGIAGGGQKPILGPPLPAKDELTWGLSDMSLQFFVNPHSESAWKWGLGPTFSLKSRSKDELAGPGWGAGAVGVLVGSLGENISLAFIGGQMWGEENDFSLGFIQPVVNYNFPSLPGMALSYNNTISYNWSASSGNEWTVPLGAGLSKTLAFKGGYGLDLGIGYYVNVEKPEGAADSVFKWAVTLLFP